MGRWWTENFCGATGRNYYETTDGLIWVVDSADHPTARGLQKRTPRTLVRGEVSRRDAADFSQQAGYSRRTVDRANCSGFGSHKNARVGTGTLRHAVQSQERGLLQGMDWCAKDIGSRIYVCD